MPANYDYAVIRVVPRVEREEFVNVGVIVACQDSEFLEARIEIDAERLLALDPGIDLATVREHLATIPAICAGRRARPALAARTLRLADRAAQRADPDLGSAHGPLRRRRSRHRASDADDGAALGRKKSFPSSQQGPSFRALHSSDAESSSFQSPLRHKKARHSGRCAAAIRNPVFE